MAVSQFQPGILIKPVNFTARNRIMTLILDTLLIIEAGDGGGTLNHTWEAFCMGRPVFLDRAAFESRMHGRNA